MKNGEQLSKTVLKLITRTCNVNKEDYVKRIPEYTHMQLLKTQNNIHISEPVNITSYLCIFKYKATYSY